MNEKKRPMVSADVEYLTDKFYKEVEHGLEVYRDLILSEKFDDFKKGYIDEEEFLEGFDYTLIHSADWDYPYDYVEWTWNLKQYVEDMIADTVKEVIMQHIDTKYLENTTIEVTLDCGDGEFEVCIDGIDFENILTNNLWRN